MFNRQPAKAGAATLQVQLVLKYKHSSLESGPGSGSGNQLCNLPASWTCHATLPQSSFYPDFRGQYLLDLCAPESKSSWRIPFIQTVAGNGERLALSRCRLVRKSLANGPRPLQLESVSSTHFKSTFATV